MPDHFFQPFFLSFAKKPISIRIFCDTQLMQVIHLRVTLELYYLGKKTCC